MQWPDNSVELLPHIAAQVAKGAGCGIAASYRPYVSFRKRGGKGSDRLISCSITGRQVDLPTEAHRSYFYLQERRADALSIEECFPFLDVAETLRLCADMGVKHPMKKGAPEPLTLDFLIRKRADNADGFVLHGRSLTSESTGLVERSLLDVIQECCVRHQVSWKVVEIASLTPTLFASLTFTRGWLRERFRPDGARESRFAQTFLRRYRVANTLKETLDATASDMKTTSAFATRQFKYAAWTGLVKVDLFSPVRLDHQLKLLRRS